jgi:hypothetical protein
MSIKKRWKGFKSLPQDIMERISDLNQLFEAEGVLLAYLFGSLAHIGAAQDSPPPQDVDFAILPSRDNFSELRDKIIESLGTERLDLVNLKTASPLLRFEVIRSGKLIYKQNDEMENDFELSTLREYKDTAYLRRKQERVLEQRTKQWLLSQK